MARNVLLKFLRATRTALNSTAAANGLTQGEPYLITDENRIAVGTGADAYSAVALQSEMAAKADVAHTQAASTISDSTTAGRALLTAADASAQRTSLGLGSAATTASTDYATATQGGKADTAQQPNVAASFAETVIAASGSTTALRITNSGSAYTFLAEDEANPDSTPFLIDGSGRVIIGKTSAVEANPQLQLYSSVLAYGPQIGIYNDYDGAGATYFNFKKRRTTDGLVSANDSLGTFAFFGHDGAAYQAAAYIQATVDATAAVNSMPGRLTFSTTASGATAATERMRIDSAGKVGFGGIAPSALLHAQSTTEQLRLGCDATKYASFTVDSTGILAVAPTLGVAVVANSTSPALRVTQTGTGYALRVEDEANPDYTSFVVDAIGRVGIGGFPYAGAACNLSSNVTGAVVGIALSVDGVVQSDVTTSSHGVLVQTKTAAESFTLTDYYAIRSMQASIGAGSAITNQYGFAADATLIGGTNNYGFFSNIPAGTGRWNFFANNTAQNYFAGNVGIGTAAISAKNHIVSTTEQLRLGYDATKYAALTVPSTGGLSLTFAGTTTLGIGVTPSPTVGVFDTLALTGGTSVSGYFKYATVQSDVTTVAQAFQTTISTQAASFTLPALSHYAASQGTIGDGSSVTYQYGFNAKSTLIGATNNYGFFSDIPDGAGRWAFYGAGTAQSYFAGNVGIGTVTPSAKTHISSTTEQLRLGYDATKYASYTVDADGFQQFTGGLCEPPNVANTGTAYTIGARSLYDLTLTGNCTFTFPTATAGRQFTLVLNQDATGSRTVTWPSSVRWPGGTAPTITATASKTDVFSFLAVGTYWLGFVGGQVFTRA
jgi:hypothetical protein